MVSMGCYGNNFFQGNRTGVTLQFKEKVVPFLNGVHYFVHKTNLIVLTLLELDKVHQLEPLL
jgi:hypothetical protein